MRQASAKPRLALVDDDRSLRVLVRLQLERHGWEVLEAGTVSDGLALIAASDPDVVLLDLQLPDGLGLELLDHLSHDGAGRGLPVIVYSGNADPTVLVSALEHGAHDFLLKPVQELELQARCAAALRVRRLHDHLATQAMTCPLTGLPNRRAAESALATALGAARRRGHQVAVLMIDVDHFKDVNDRLGHAEGDRLLKALSGALLARTRDEDVLARWGGDEFVALLSVADVPAAELAAARLLAAARELDASLSIGWALSRPDERDEALIARADDALLAAKADGRARAAGSLDDQLTAD